MPSRGGRATQRPCVLLTTGGRHSIADLEQRRDEGDDEEPTYTPQRQPQLQYDLPTLEGTAVVS